jgi:hypothetical protein
MLNERFGRLAIIDLPFKKNGRRYVKYRCNNCGDEKTVCLSRLVNESYKCGCHHREIAKKINDKVLFLFGESKTIRQWGKDRRCRLDIRILKIRMKSGCEPENALTPLLRRRLCDGCQDFPKD